LLSDFVIFVTLKMIILPVEGDSVSVFIVVCIIALSLTQSNTVKAVFLT